MLTTELYLILKNGEIMSIESCDDHMKDAILGAEEKADAEEILKFMIDESSDFSSHNPENFTIGKFQLTQIE